MDFYGDVLRNLIVALGGAMVVGNVLALVNRRRDRDDAAKRTVAQSRPGSPVRGYRHDASVTDLPEAPVGRSVAFIVVGGVMVLWWVATVAS